MPPEEEQILDQQSDTGTETQAQDPVVQPQYMTKADFDEFRSALLQDIKSSIPQPQVQQQQQEHTEEWDAPIVAKAEARMYEANRRTYLKDIISEVAGDLPKASQDYIAEQLKGVPGQGLANILNSEGQLDSLKNLAIGYNYKTNPPKTTQAPTSKGKVGTTNPASMEENDLVDYYMKSYAGIGLTREMAQKWAKEGR